MEPEVIASRVREAVARSGLTQAEFAAQAGLDGPKLSKSLAGVRRFTSLDLANIAELAEVTVDWLLGKETVTPALAARAVAPLSASVDGAVEVATRYARVRSDLNLLGRPRPEPVVLPVPDGGRWVDQGAELAAEALRRVPGHAADPAAADLPGLIEEHFGIDVVLAQLPPGCDGLAWHEPDVRLIVCATSPTPTRQRFTLAHELGHLLVGDDQRLHIDEDVMDPDGRRQPTEMRANAFAAAFLMPEPLLRGVADFGDERGFAALVLRLAVSPSALAYRLNNLGLIDDEQRARFGRLTTTRCAQLVDRVETYVDWAARSARSRPPVALLGDLLSAYLDGATTLRPLANLTGFAVDDLRRELEPAADADQDGPVFAP